jgi:hypothetical protein
VESTTVTKEEKVGKVTAQVVSDNSENSKLGAASVCSICKKPATQLIDGEPSCADHIGQIYEHQVEDYAQSHLSEWRK